MLRAIISTSVKPCDESKNLARLLKRIIPNCKYIPRGRKSLAKVIDIAMDEECKYLFLIGCKKGRVDQINFYKRVNEGFVHDAYFLKIYEYIDPKIFNFSNIPIHGPISTTLETRIFDRELMDLFEMYFGMVFGTKTRTWLFLDRKDKSSYIQLIEARTQRRFAMIRLDVRKRS